MNAVISGQAGIALLLDGEEISSIHAGRPGEATPRSPAEVSLLIGDAKDLQFLEGTDIEKASNLLEQASEEVDALHLALILLDESLSHDTRRTAAEELDELLDGEENRRFVENILHAHPLPAGADLGGALAVCPGNANLTRRLLEELRSLQTVIAEIYFAWEEIPDGLFGDKRDRAFALSLAVREGFFRDLVALRAVDGSIDSFLRRSVANKAFQGVYNQGDILRAWLAPLRLHERAQPRQIEVDLRQSTVAEDTEGDRRAPVLYPPEWSKHSDINIPSSDVDQRLVEQIQAGVRREENFEILFHKFQHLVHFFFLRKGFSSEESRDLTREVFLMIFKGIDSFRSESRFERWLFEIADNIYLNELRRRWEKRHASEFSLAAPVEGSSEASAAMVTPAADLSPDEQLFLQRNLKAFRLAFQEFPAQMRRCCILRYEQGLKYQEIADVMEISIETVKAHLNMARKRLLAQLENEEAG